MDWNNSRDVLKALLFLYSEQTAEEQKHAVTVCDNGRGFNAVDAPFATSVATQILRGYGISTKQFEAVKKIVRGYPRQVADIDFSTIELPSTATIYDKSKVKSQQLDGILDVTEKDELTFTPHIYPSVQIKELGFSWDKENGYWRGEYGRDKVRRVCELFQKTRVSDELTLRLETERQTFISEEIAESPLFAYQKEAASFIRVNQRAMLALAPGLGKTAVSIFAAKSVGKKILVVCPLSLARNWRAEIKKWTGDEAQIWHQDLRYSDQWVITNYESILGLWVDYDTKVVKKQSGKMERQKVNWRCVVDHDFDVLIIDETIMVKNRKAQRTKAVGALAKTFEYVWNLSGNPVSRLYDDLWAQFHLLYPNRFTSYWKFAKEYCFVEQKRWGWTISANQPDAERRLMNDVADFYFARTQDQVLDLPEWIFEPLEISMYPDQYKLYKEMEETFKAILPEGDVIVAKIVLSQLLRLVQFASNPLLVDGPDRGAKWDIIPEIMEYNQPPFIIWTRFIPTAENITTKLSTKKFRVAALTGKTPVNERQNIVDDYQKGQYDAIVAHPAVGKFGFTLSACRTAIYLERGYSGDDNYQSLHRVRRIGTKWSPLIIQMLACRPDTSEPTVDHVIHKILEYRMGNSVAITSGEIREYFGF